ncbi:MAG: Gfo/Idh/MocA family oxidoreductase [Acidobacteria bacterium]|nr:Gfo/Idh/MocA family oxidoreductase [Acidobacteriota bacterium]
MTSGSKQSTAPRKIRYAVVGLGYISQAAVLPAFAHAKENSELAALVSGDEAKLKKLARNYKVHDTYSYEQYEECLKGGNIDAVYIALPNNMHLAYAEAAANAGIHVLCEKPMAVNERECKTMIDAAERAKVKLMIAYRLHFEKGNLSAIASIRDGKIGEPRIFTSTFCQQVTEGNSRLDEELAGGPLYDIGVYCINAARNLFRAEPTEVFAFTASSNDKRFTEVPEMSSAVLRFPDNRLASFTCSFGAADRSIFEVVGTKAALKMDPAYEMIADLKSEMTVGERSTKAKFSKRDQFGPELVYFSDCVLSDKEPEPGGLEGLADVRVINALFESQNSGRPVKIAPVDIGKRPGMDQEIHKPPVPKPQLFKAAAPSK